MKLYLRFLAVGFAFGVLSCEPELDNPIDEIDFTSGTADFSNYVAVGNSLTAGFADGALYITGQEDSYPNIMATQFAFANGGAFTQPLMNDNLGGLLLGGQQITQNRFVLASDGNGNPGLPAILSGMPSTEVSNTLSGPFNNMGVPGARSFDLLFPGYGNIANVQAGLANPFYARFASSSNATVIGDAVAANPTFFSLWIGNNDLLGYATSGGAGVDQTGNLDPSTYGGNDITDPSVFASIYSTMVEALVSTGADGVLINLPDVTSIPFLTTVPPQSIPLDDQAQVDLVNGQFALYNSVVLPTLVQVGVISEEEAASRQVSFELGVNFPIIIDDNLTDVSAVLQGPPAFLDEATATLLGQLRQATNEDLLTLTSLGQLGQLADPNNPLSIIGVAVPLTDQFVLTIEEQTLVNNAQASFNATIQALAAANGLAFVDARSALQQVAAGGVAFDGGLLTSDFVTGGAFSLDGVHPTPRGYALTANTILSAINAQYGSNIPLVNIGEFGTVTLSDDIN